MLSFIKAQTFCRDIMMYLIVFLWIIKFNFPPPKPQSRGPKVIKETEKKKKE